MSVHLAQKLQTLWHYVRHAARKEQVVVQPVLVQQDIIHLQHSAAALQPNALLVLELVLQHNLNQLNVPKQAIVSVQLAQNL